MSVPAATARRVVRNDLVAGFLKASDQYAATSAAKNAPRPDFAHALIRDAYRGRASDLHLDPQSVGLRVRFRIDGAVSDVAYLDTEQGKTLVNQFKALADLDPVTRFTPKDAHGSVEFDGRRLDIRLAIAPCLGGEKISVRLLDHRQRHRSIKELGFAPDKLEWVENWLERGNGMVLAAGPTGCGKTTTVYALLEELRFADHTIVSLEDPVECRIDGITQIQIDELHNLTYAEGAKAMLRLDPDYLMLGELRDPQSAHSAVNAAIGGRVLLSTIHCRDAVGAITTLRNWGLEDHELAESIVLVIAQRLVRKLCPYCRQASLPSESELRWLKSVDLPAPSRVWQAKGCRDCRHLGYLGRTGIFELWRLRERDYDLLLQHADEQSLRQHLAGRGHTTLVNDALAKVQEGVTSLAELQRMGTGSFPSQHLNFLPPSASTPPSASFPHSDIRLASLAKTGDADRAGKSLPDFENRLDTR